MNKWVKISDYLFFQEGPGVRNNQYTSEGVKLLNVANLVNGEVDLSTSNRYISVEEAYGKYKHFLADEGDLIIASSGIKVEYFDKKMGFIKKEHLPICMNTSTIRFKSLDINKLNINYFMYYLKSQSFKSQLSKQITGSAQLNFGPSHLKKMKFPIVSLNEQLLINSILGNLDNQIRLKEKQIIEYDSLIKSRFVEMFESFEKTDLSNIAEIIMGQSPDSAYYNENGFGLPFFQSKADFGAKYTSVSYWTTKPSKTAKKGNVLMSVRAPVGPVNISSVDCCIGRGLCSINAIPNKTNNEFLYNALIAIQDQITAMGTGSTFKAINKSDVYAIQIPLAPISLQNEFANFVEQVDKLKFENELLYCVNRFTRINKTILVC